MMEERDLRIEIIMHAKKSKFTDSEIIRQLMDEISCSAVYLDSYATSIAVYNEGET